MEYSFKHATIAFLSFNIILVGMKKRFALIGPWVRKLRRYKTASIDVEDRVADHSYSAPHRKRLLAAPSSDRYVSRLLQGKFSGGAKRFTERVLLVVEPSSTFCMHFCVIFHLRRRTTSASSLPIHNPPSHHLWLIVFYCSARIAAVCRVGGAKLLLCRAGG